MDGSDATGHDALSFYLAYLHPLWMLTSIAAAAAVLRLGLQMRKKRLGTAAPDSPQKAYLRRAHLMLAKPTVVALMLGFAGGPISVWWLRGWTPFATFHSLLGFTAALLFGLAAWRGHQAEQGDREARSPHGWLGLGAMLFAAGASVAGFVLLP